jgi:hypothetical protein
MFSPKQITKLTAVGLTVGAIAAPAASAMPIGGFPTQTPSHSAPAPQAKQSPAVRQVKYLASSRQLKPSGSAYSRQDKQLVPRSQPQAPTTVPTAVRHANPSGGSDWTYAAIGAGGALTLALVGLGGAFAVSERRSRKPALAAS